MFIRCCSGRRRIRSRRLRGYWGSRQRGLHCHLHQRALFNYSLNVCKERFCKLQTPRPVGNRHRDTLRILIIGTAIYQSAGSFLPHPTPLFEKEWHSVCAALIANGDDPLPLDWACTGPTLTTDYYPTDTRKVQFAKILQKWLDGEEFYFRRSVSEIIESWETMLSIFDADAPPNVFRCGSELQFARQQFAQSLGSFGQHLIGVPVRRDHDARHSLAVVIGNTCLE